MLINCDKKCFIFYWFFRPKKYKSCAKEWGRYGNILNLIVLNRVYVFELRKWTSIFKIKMISAHLDPTLINFGQKVNIRLFNQKFSFLILYYSHKCVGNLWCINTFSKPYRHHNNETPSVVYIRLMLRVVEYLPFAVGRSPSRNCQPDPTIK